MYIHSFPKVFLPLVGTSHARIYVQVFHSKLKILLFYKSYPHYSSSRCLTHSAPCKSSPYSSSYLSHCSNSTNPIPIPSLYFASFTATILCILSQVLSFVYFSHCSASPNPILISTLPHCSASPNFSLISILTHCFFSVLQPQILC